MPGSLFADLLQQFGYSGVQLRISAGAGLSKSARYGNIYRPGVHFHVGSIGAGDSYEWQSDDGTINQGDVARVNNPPGCWFAYNLPEFQRSITFAEIFGIR